MPTEQKRPMSFMRWVFAIFGALIMVFTGGCALILGFNAPGVLGVFILISAIPFLIGWGIWWAAVKRGR